MTLLIVYLKVKALIIVFPSQGIPSVDRAIINEKNGVYNLLVEGSACMHTSILLLIVCIFTSNCKTHQKDASLFYNGRPLI